MFEQVPNRKMDERLSELKEKQAEIGDKISVLQKTNQKKDEEAAEIRRLIAECRENLNRIKGTVPGTEELLKPCSQLALNEAEDEENEQRRRPTESEQRRGSTESEQRRGSTESEQRRGSTESEQRRGSTEGEQRRRSTEGEQRRRSTEGEQRRRSTEGEQRRRSTEGEQMRRSAENMQRRRPTENEQKRRPTESEMPITNDGDARRSQPCVPEAKAPSKKDCLASKSKLSKKGGKERVSCKVDLNKMKVRIRGPSEDLKKLDAEQLISLLEKFQCQELIINTGDEIVQDPGEIRLIYLMHPGNIIMLAGIIMVAFLINTNLFHFEYSQRTLFFLNLLWVGSAAFHYGMVLWMTFIRGYALRCGLNPDMFQLVDNIMLPKYYSVCVLLSALCLYSFLATHSLSPCSSWPLSVLAQLIVMVTTFIMELITICYVIPALIKLRDATEDYIFDEEDTECAVPESYERNMVKLCKLNWTLCLINFLTLILLGANIYYLTCQLGKSSSTG